MDAGPFVMKDVKETVRVGQMGREMLDIVQQGHTVARGRKRQIVIVLK